MDTDNSGTITYEELRAGLQRLGSKLTEAEVQQLMEAVSYGPVQQYLSLVVFFYVLSSLHSFA